MTTGELREEKKRISNMRSNMSFLADAMGLKKQKKKSMEEIIREKELKRQVRQG